MMPNAKLAITRDELPDWMQPKRRGIDLGLLCVVVLCLVLARPWFAQDHAPNTPHIEAQLGRVAEVEHNFRSGILYPRWASHFHFGYGSPMLNHVPPAPHYVVALHMLLAQTNPLFSFANVMIAAIVGSGVAMFTLLRRQVGGLCAFVGTLLFLLSPATLYNTSFIQANMGEIFAIALFPTVLWAIDRTVYTRHPRDVALMAAGAALLLLSAQVMAWAMLAICFGYSLWFGVAHSARPWRLMIVGWVAAFCLAGLFWIPAYAEADTITWVTLQNPQPISFDFVRFFSLSHSHDPLQFNTQPLMVLGVAWGALWVASSIIILYDLLIHRGQTAHLAGLPLVMSSFSLFALIAFLPDDWFGRLPLTPPATRQQLLAPLAICGCILAAHLLNVFLQVIQRRLWATGGVLLVTLAIAITYLPQTQPPGFVRYRSSNTPLNHYLQAELSGVVQGGFVGGYLLPAGLERPPQPSYLLIDSILEDEVIKVERASRLPTENFAMLSHNPTRDVMRLNNPTVNNLEILTLNAMGWRGYFMGEPITLISTEDGLISARVPQGAGELRIQYQNTLVRNLATLLTLASAVIGGALVVVASSNLRVLPEPAKIQAQHRVVVALVLITLGVLLLPLQLNQPSNHLAQIERLPRISEGGLDLLGYTLDYHPSQRRIDLSLYWQAVRPNLPNYTVAVQLIDANTGQIGQQQSRVAPGGWLTSLWKLDQYMVDTYRFGLDDSLSDTVSVAIVVQRCNPLSELLACENPDALQFFDPLGTPTGESIRLPRSIRQ